MCVWRVLAHPVDAQSVWDVGGLEPGSTPCHNL